MIDLLSCLMMFVDVHVRDHIYSYACTCTLCENMHTALASIQTIIPQPKEVRYSKKLSAYVNFGHLS